MSTLVDSVESDLIIKYFMDESIKDKQRKIKVEELFLKIEVMSQNEFDIFMSNFKNLDFILALTFEKYGSKLDDFELDAYNIDNDWVNDFYYYKGYAIGLSLGTSCVAYKCEEP